MNTCIISEIFDDKVELLVEGLKRLGPDHGSFTADERNHHDSARNRRWVVWEDADPKACIRMQGRPQGPSWNLTFEGNPESAGFIEFLLKGKYFWVSNHKDEAQDSISLAVAHAVNFTKLNKGDKRKLQKFIRKLPRLYNPLLPK